MRFIYYLFTILTDHPIISNCGWSNMNHWTYYILTWEIYYLKSRSHSVDHIRFLTTPRYGDSSIARNRQTSCCCGTLCSSYILTSVGGWLERVTTVSSITSPVKWVNYVPAETLPDSDSKTNAMPRMVGEIKSPIHVDNKHSVGDIHSPLFLPILNWHRNTCWGCASILPYRVHVGSICIMLLKR